MKGNPPKASGGLESSRRRITTPTTPPATLSATPSSAMKSERQMHSRVKKRYPGWGQTVHGFEGGSQS